jgi:hypothetical protein
MANRVFISFKAEDKPQVDGLRLLAKNPNYELEFYDESVRVAIDSGNATYIKTRIREKIERSGVVLCLVSPVTHTSNWVSWELETAIALGKPIVAMAIKGLQNATLPAPIRNRVSFYAWNPGSLGTYLADAKVVPRA